MGLSILPSYANESPVAANSVVITRVVNSPDVWGYNMSIQKDNNTVTNPLPGTWSEVTVGRPVGIEGGLPGLTTLRFAKPTAKGAALTTTVLPQEITLQMAKIAYKTELAYCKARSDYFPGKNCTHIYRETGKPRALDMEMKYLQNGQFVLKQVREFGGK